MKDYGKYVLIGVCIFALECVLVLALSGTFNDHDDDGDNEVSSYYGSNY